MKFTFYGHASFSVETNGKTILFDPFITPNKAASHINVSQLKPDYILLSHGHGDHIADCIAIAGQSGASVFGPVETMGWLEKQGLMNGTGINHGGKKTFDWGSFKAVNAIHSSSLPDGTYGGNPMGFVVTGDKSFYYSGDTALMMDMQLVPKWATIDFAVLCMGDHFTMGYEDAVEAAKMVGAKQVIGVHYDTFPPIKMDHEKAKKAFADAGITLHLPGIGESIEL